MKRILLILATILLIIPIEAHPCLSIDISDELDAVTDEILWTRACRCLRCIEQLEHLVAQAAANPGINMHNQLAAFRRHVARHADNRCSSDQVLLNHLRQLVRTTAHPI